jgi:tRNA pseudouridine38-40 synthase
MSVLLATLGYDGTRFAGWQRQEGRRTVQGVLEEALAHVARTPIAVRAAGRTDSGVHARGQRASFLWTGRLTPRRLLRALDGLLPEDVAVLALEERPRGFDVRRDSLGKRYVYRVHVAPHRPLFERRYVWHRYGELDLEAMRAAARHLVGELNFESFRRAGCQATHAQRCVWRVAVLREGPVFSFDVRGNAFVRGMVRAMAGTMVDVGRGRFPPQALPGMIAARDRGRAGVSAPAHGLTLEEVYLPGDEERAGIPDWASWPGFRRPR